MNAASQIGEGGARPQLHLASTSPRRAELLRQIGVGFDVVTAVVDETPSPAQAPAGYTLTLALAKARAPRCDDGLPVLGGDTVVALDGEILGKPRDRAHALEMLSRLSGRSHEVYSAVAVAVAVAVVEGQGADVGFDTALSMTRVTFGPVTPAEAAAYWASGEPADKAGAYAIQGKAARWVRRIEGSYSGVVGLPLYETAQLLARFGVVPRFATGSGTS